MPSSAKEKWLQSILLAPHTAIFYLNFSVSIPLQVPRGTGVIYEEAWDCRNLKKGQEGANGLTEHDWTRFQMFWVVLEVKYLLTFPYAQGIKEL